MKFEIKNRFTGAVKFTAEIECEEGTSTSIKLGLAVKWAVKAGAYLADANLAGAYLARANLADADLAGAGLNGLSGLNGWVKCIQIEDWPITYTSEVMQIGCQRHSHEEWRGFSDAEIRRMDGMKALTFWHKWKGWIFQTIEMAPALPTKPANTEGSQ